MMMSIVVVYSHVVKVTLNRGMRVGPPLGNTIVYSVYNMLHLSFKFEYCNFAKTI